MKSRRGDSSPEHDAYRNPGEGYTAKAVAGTTKTTANPGKYTLRETSGLFNAYRLRCVEPRR